MYSEDIADGEDKQLSDSTDQDNGRFDVKLSDTDQDIDRFDTTTQ
jgi:hypothetical protein